jgi:hypothetical protein
MSSWYVCPCRMRKEDRGWSSAFDVKVSLDIDPQEGCQILNDLVLYFVGILFPRGKDEFGSHRAMQKGNL